MNCGKRFLALLGSALLLSAVVPAADPADGRRLSTEEIRRVFADVRDDAELQDAVGTRAVNYWYSNGTFTNEWSNARGSGKVTGRWRAHDNQRCIIITTGLPDRTGKESCGPLFRRGQKIISVSSDGGIHGIHTLSTIDRP